MSQAPRGRSRAVSAGVALLGVVAGAAATRMGLGSLADPGPGLWPLAVSALIAGSSLVTTLTGSESGAEVFTQRSRRVAAALAGIVTFALLFPAVGALLPAVGLLVFWLRVLAAEPWRIALPLAIVVPVALAVVFRTLLGVPLPPDLLLGEIALLRVG